MALISTSVSGPFFSAKRGQVPYRAKRAQVPYLAKLNFWWILKDEYLLRSQMQYFSFIFISGHFWRAFNTALIQHFSFRYFF